jgi:malonyl CoA-acyl carrier protein transacylase
VLGLTSYTQPALFALQVALYRLVESFGVTPDFLLGHSVGEIAAAHVAGVLSLRDACTLVVHRSRLMQALPAGGTMVSVRAGEAEVAEAMAALGADGHVSIAALNSPASTVVSGDAELVAELAKRWRAEGRRTRALTVSHAFHSAHMDPMLADFRAVVRTLELRPPRIPVVADSTGQVSTDLTDPEYWVTQVRLPVRFADGVATLRAAGVDRYLEIGPDATLISLVGECMAGAGPDDVLLVPALRRGRPESRTLLAGLARLAVRGVPIDWAPVWRDTGARFVELPTYPFRGRRFWLDAEPRRPDDDGADATFWDAVIREDADAAAGQLGLPDQLRASLAALLPALSVWRRRTGWRHRVVWSLLGDQRPALRPAGTWLIVTPAAGSVDGWDEALSAALGADAVTLDPGAPHTGVICFGHAFDSAALVPVWRVTRDAVVLDGGAPPSADAPLSAGTPADPRAGWAGVVDVPGHPDAASVAALVAALAGGENDLAIRGSATYARRIVPAGTGDPPGWQPTGTVLVIGGPGGLAPATARWLARGGAKRIVVTAPVTPGVDVTVAECDPRDPAALTALIATLAETDALTAVVAADPLPRASVLALSEATAGLGLSLFIFELLAEGPGSATASALARRGAARVVHWGQLAGMRPMPAEIALDALLELDDAELVLADADWPAVAAGYPRLEPLLRPMLGPVPAISGDVAAEVGPAPLRASLAGLNAANRTRLLLDLVRDHASTVLALSGPDDVGEDDEFVSLGFSSFTALELRNVLCQATGLDLPVVAVFDHATPAALARFLDAELSGESS